MIRFIDLGNQTGNIDYENGEREFAFFNTVTNTFEVFSGFQVWTSIEDFRNDYRGPEFDRYLGKIPKNYFKE